MLTSSIWSVHYRCNIMLDSVPLVCTWQIMGSSSAVQECQSCRNFIGEADLQRCSVCKLLSFCCSPYVFKSWTWLASFDWFDRYFFDYNVRNCPVMYKFVSVCPYAVSNSVFADFKALSANCSCNLASDQNRLFTHCSQNCLCSWCRWQGIPLYMLTSRKGKRLL